MEEISIGKYIYVIENKGMAFAKLNEMKWPVNPNHLIFKITLNIIYARKIQILKKRGEM